MSTSLWFVLLAPLGLLVAVGCRAPGAKEAPLQVQESEAATEPVVRTSARLVGRTADGAVIVVHSVRLHGGAHAGFYFSEDWASGAELESHSVLATRVVGSGADSWLAGLQVTPSFYVGSAATCPVPGGEFAVFTGCSSISVLGRLRVVRSSELGFDTTLLLGQGRAAWNGEATPAALEWARDATWLHDSLPEAYVRVLARSSTDSADTEAREYTDLDSCRLVRHAGGLLLGLHAQATIREAKADLVRSMQGHVLVAHEHDLDSEGATWHSTCLGVGAAPALCAMSGATLVAWRAFDQSECSRIEVRLVRGADELTFSELPDLHAPSNISSRIDVVDLAGRPAVIYAAADRELHDGASRDVKLLQCWALDLTSATWELVARAPSPIAHVDSGDFDFAASSDSSGVRCFVIADGGSMDVHLVPVDDASNE